MPVIEVPWQRLPPETLQQLIEEFITREGTDYGIEELSLESKVSRLQTQIEQGRVLIIFDDETESCQLIEKENRPKYA